MPNDYWFIFITSVILVIVYCPAVHSVSDGTVRLYRNGVSDTNQSWSSGIVQIYLAGEWGNICDDEHFGKQEADVLCRQLGYKGAATFSNTGLSKEYGVDNSSTAMNDVFCGFYSLYLSITQCEFDTIKSQYCGDDNDVIVTCSTNRIWGSTPYTDHIRLTGGNYSNQGLLEVYCNGEWGTVCDSTFGDEQALVACSTLGYNGYSQYNHLKDELQVGNISEIWLNSLGGCEYSDSCFHNCQACPAVPYTGLTVCDHSQDVTLECEYISLRDKNSVVYETCSDLADILGEIIAVVVVSILICCYAAVGVCVVPLCICCCLGIGIGSVMGKSKKPAANVTYTHNNQSTEAEHVYTATPTAPSADEKLDYV